MNLIKGINLLKYILLSRPKGWFEFIKSSFSYLFKTQYNFGKPIYIIIEPTNICNLKCEICETGANLLSREKGFMSFENFKIIIDKIHFHTNGIMLYFMGETFLNKDAYKMINYSKSKNIYVEVCTNGDLVNPELMIKSGLDEVNFQISGLTQETHEYYRKNSNLERILNNLKKTLELKKKYGLNKPCINLGFIVMKQNEHQIEDVKKLGKDLGVDEVQFIGSCVRTIEQGKKFLPENDDYMIYDRTKYEKEKKLLPKIIATKCSWIYYSFSVFFNGDVVPCCRDPYGKYIMGNLINQGVEEIWNGQKIKKFRKFLKNNQSDMDICKLCSGFGVPRLK